MPKRPPPPVATPTEVTPPSDDGGKRKPGRPKKGFVKVLVSLDPIQAELLANTAFIRGAIEGRRGDVSALIREIIEKSKYWDELAHSTVAAMEAINRSSLASKAMADVVGKSKAKSKEGKPNPDAVDAALRAGYIAFLKDKNKNHEDFSFDSYRLADHIIERRRMEAAAAVKKARERAGFTPEGLARRAGLPVKKVESAERGYIDGEIATKLAVPLQVNPHALCPLDLWGQPKPKEPSET